MKTDINQNLQSIICFAADQEACNLNNDEVNFINQEISRDNWANSHFIALVILTVNAQTSIIENDRSNALPYAVTHDEGEPVVVEDFEHENNFMLSSAPKTLLLTINALKVLKGELNGRLTLDSCRSLFEEVVFKNDDTIIDVSVMARKVVEQTITIEMEKVFALISVNNSFKILNAQSEPTKDEAEFEKIQDANIVDEAAAYDTPFSEWDVKPKSFTQSEGATINPFSI